MFFAQSSAHELPSAIAKHAWRSEQSLERASCRTGVFHISVQASSVIVAQRCYLGALVFSGWLGPRSRGRSLATRLRLVLSNGSLLTSCRTTATVCRTPILDSSCSWLVPINSSSLDSFSRSESTIAQTHYTTAKANPFFPLSNLSFSSPSPFKAQTTAQQPWQSRPTNMTKSNSKLFNSSSNYSASAAAMKPTASRGATRASCYAVDAVTAELSSYHYCSTRAAGMSLYFLSRSFNPPTPRDVFARHC